MNEPDKVTGLTPREKREVVESWTLIKKDIRKNAEELLVRFCVKFPEHHQRFKPFADVPLHKLRGNRKLQSHANSVMYALGAVVENLDDTACLIEMLMKLGTSHADRNVPEQGFKDLKSVYLELIQEKLGPKLSDSGREAWNKTMNVAYAVIFRGMREAQEESSKAGPSRT